MNHGNSKTYDTGKFGYGRRVAVDVVSAGAGGLFRVTIYLANQSVVQIRQSDAAKFEWLNFT